MLALDGIRVLDLSRLAPGPYCTMLLGDMGADVLLVERVGEIDDRGRHNALRRNKRSICIDLKSDDGRALFLELAKSADVILEGYRPGVVKRLGIDFAAAREINDRIVYCSLSGYGQTGPYAQMAGHDINYAAIGGALGANGRPGTRPAVPLNLLADYAGGGLMAAFSIAVALLARERTGRGQYIDLAMSDGVISLMTQAASDFFGNGVVPRPGEHRINGGAPNYDVYECKDGRWLSVGTLEPKFAANLCTALQVDSVDDLRGRLLQKTRDEWFASLVDLDVCVTPVYSIDEVFEDPHNKHRHMALEVDGIKQVGIAPKLSETPGAVRSNAPRPGQDTDAVLADLGHNPSAIEQLREDAVVG